MRAVGDTLPASPGLWGKKNSDGARSMRAFSTRPHQLMTDTTIRQAGIQDLDRLVPLFDAYRRFYGQPSDLNLARQFLRDRLARGESVMLIAEDHAGVAIGFAQLYPTLSSILAAPMYLLSDVFVVPSARRQGVGAMLLKGAAEAARAIGAVRLELATAITNDPARRLYEQLGWKRDEEFLMYYLPLLNEGARDRHE